MFGMFRRLAICSINRTQSLLLRTESKSFGPTFAKLPINQKVYLRSFSTEASKLVID